MAEKPWYKRLDDGYVDPQREPASMSEMLGQAPLPTDPVAGAIQSVGPMTEYSGGAPVGAADFMPPIPRDWKEAAILAAMSAAPVMGQAAWKARGVPKATIEALKRGKGDPLHARIQGRSELYHATDLPNATNILETGEIRPSLGTLTKEWKSDPKISTSRVPGVMSNFKNRWVTFVVDKEKIPHKGKPTVDVYGKTYRDDPLFGKSSERMDPDFEFDTQFGRSIPTNAVKEIVADREALIGDLALQRTGVSGWTGADEAAEIAQHADNKLADMAAKASESGVPFRVVNTTRDLKSDRVRRFYQRAESSGGSR